MSGALLSGTMSLVYPAEYAGNTWSPVNPMRVRTGSKGPIIPSLNPKRTKRGEQKGDGTKDQPEPAQQEDQPGAEALSEPASPDFEKNVVTVARHPCTC